MQIRNNHERRRWPKWKNPEDFEIQIPPSDEASEYSL